MINYVEYNKDDFSYDIESNTLSADEEDLYHYYRKQIVIFPNKRKQFWIKNHRTKNKRKFILKNEDEFYYTFISDVDEKVEKPIICKIKKLIFVW